MCCNLWTPSDPTACAPQQAKPPQWEVHAPQRERRPCSPQLETVLSQQQKTSAAKSKYRKIQKRKEPEGKEDQFATYSNMLEESANTVWMSSFTVIFLFNHNEFNIRQALSSLFRGKVVTLWKVKYLVQVSNPSLFLLWSTQSWHHRIFLCSRLCSLKSG